MYASILLTSIDQSILFCTIGLGIGMHGPRRNTVVRYATHDVHISLLSAPSRVLGQKEPIGETPLDNFSSVGNKWTLLCMKH